jgi:hypothetical protein
MRAVEIRLQPSELSEQMGAMRIWLDEQRVESSSFKCHDNEYCVLLSLEFKVARHAEEFARRFNGRISGPLDCDHDGAPTGQILETGLSPPELVR